MCLESIRVGRRIGTATTIIAAPSGIVQACGQNSKRVTLRLSYYGPPGVAGANPWGFVAPQEQMDGLNSQQGFVLSPYAPEIVLTVERDGLVVTQPWYCLDQNGNGFMVQESLL